MPPKKVKTNEPVPMAPLDESMNAEWQDTIISKDGLGPWSYSKKKLLQQCPLKFFLSYVLKWKVPRIQDGTLPVTDIGSALHLILEHVTVGKSITDAYKLTHRKHFEAIGAEFWEQYVVGNEYNIVAFRQRLDDFERKFPVKRYLCEIRMAVDRNWEATDFFANDVHYRGVVDLVIQMENGDGLIIDHKSVLNSNGFLSVKNFKEQLEVYKPLIHYGLVPLTGAQSGIHFIADGEVKFDDYHSKEQIEGRLRHMVEYNVDSAVENVKELGYFKRKAGGHCKWCDYRQMCKDKENPEHPRFRQLEKDSAVLFIPTVAVD